MLLISGSCNTALVNAVKNSRVILKPSPIENAKTIKNNVELEGFRQCHLRDAAALCNYFGWLQNELDSGREWDEVDGAVQLEKFRRAQKNCVGLSFPTISAVGPNASIIHYKPEKETAVKITKKLIYLLDSGGQYLDGTTDVTRTVHFGTPTEEEKENFTRVLQGNIALSCAVFPNGTSGMKLDCLARQPLWEVGLDYRHGTGHGVGHYLNVHEGPQSISFHPRSNDVSLKAGMTITNEPGYYADGKYGIRIENVLIVKPAQVPNSSGDGFLKTENITMVPIQRKLIKQEMLSKKEVAWLNDFHAACWTKVSPLLEPGSLGYKWLRSESMPLAQ